MSLTWNSSHNACQQMEGRKLRNEQDVKVQTTWDLSHLGLVSPGTCLTWDLSQVMYSTKKVKAVMLYLE